MENKEAGNQSLTGYKEVKIGKTIYRVTSVYLGEIDLQETLEELTARKVLDEILCQENLAAAKA